ncbi:MAG: zinc ribbon domain-containing protein [Candidatus Brockarchaeota archaeon]|nr:zinc ribbon domain-containing protein [Candidatus Brockarchaeota archaeon]
MSHGICPNPECQAIMPPNAKFCGKCGTKLTDELMMGMQVYDIENLYVGDVEEKALFVAIKDGLLAARWSKIKKYVGDTVIILAEKVNMLPRPKIQLCSDEPLFIYSREESGGELPTIDSCFLDWIEGTFCIWVKVVPELREKSYRYIFSHASDWRDETRYPNAFCIHYLKEKSSWVFLFHGDPKKEADRIFAKKIPFSSTEDGVRLFSVRWRKNQAEVEVLIDDRVRCRLYPFTNWPKSANSPVYIGGWIAGGWDSYIHTKVFNVRVFDRWLNDEQIRLLLHERPEM